MSSTPHAIQSYSLFGESTHLPDVLHCETIADRSVLHDWEFVPHRHTRLHQLLLVESGGGVAHLDVRTLVLSPGSLLNVPPGHVHAFRFRKGTQGLVLTLADELLSEIFVGVGDVRSDLGRTGLIQADEQTRLLMRQIWREFLGRSSARALVLRGLSAALFGWVVRAMGVHGPEEAHARRSDLVQRFQLLIEDHFRERWHVADYAKALSVSPTHLSRLTRAATGASASRLIEARIVLEARRQLAYTNLSVSTISYAVGYTDPAYFTRVFTRDAGLSPRAFRARLAGQPTAPKAHVSPAGAVATTAASRGAQRRTGEGSFPLTSR